MHESRFAGTVYTNTAPLTVDAATGGVVDELGVPFGASPVDGCFHFLGVLFIYNPALRRTMRLASNLPGLTRWLLAQPRRLLLSAPVGSFPPGESALLGLLIGLLRQS